MKNSLLKTWFIATLMVMVSLGGFAQSAKITAPVEYNDYIVDQQNLIGGELLKLIDMFGALPEDKTVCTDQLEVILVTCKTGIDNLEKLKTIQHDFELKQSAIELFQFYNTIIDTDYRTVIDQLYAEEPDMNLMKEILERIQTSEGAVDAKFQKAQSEFAKYHNIQLEENELQEDFDKVDGQ